MNHTITDTTAHLSSTGTSPWWPYLLLAAAVLILLLIIARRLRRHPSRAAKRRADKRKLLDGTDVDFNNIINSSFAARQLYDELKVKCHPDRFLDPALNAIATSLYQAITENRYNHKRLLELKQQAIQQLKIKTS